MIEPALFESEFCYRCKRDALYQKGIGDSCEIIASAYRETPKEWVRGLDGKLICTAFEDHGTPDRQDPNAAVRDLFEGIP